MKDEIQERLEKVWEKIEKAKIHSRRTLDKVCLVAVTKGVGPGKIQRVIESGIEDLGENRWQEFRDKFPLVDSVNTPGIRWHFIGRLQKNKVKHIVKSMYCVQSLDSWELALELNHRVSQKNKRPFPVLVQVNLSGNPVQSGFKENELFPFLERLTELDNLMVNGFMTIAPFVQEEKVVRETFSRLRMLRDMARQRNLPGGAPGDLSMGMSEDYEWAVEEGATILRLGRALFGERRP